MHNVSKHAKARKAVLRVTEESKGTLFELIDDGIGVEQSKEIAKKTRKNQLDLECVLWNIEHIKLVPNIP